MNLIKSTGTFTFFTLISRVLGYIRDILIAIFLGTGPMADAFFVAFRIPNTFRRLFSEGTFNAAFVPSYASELSQGKDQSEKFGGDSSRSFLFSKRPVQDKDMGLFIKTIMVRCIHCTRCIRFLKDKALTNDLGTIGRGEKTEISFYFNKFLDKSLLSGNIVDICPVGALTNKDYSFKGRPWEMDEIKYI